MAVRPRPYAPQSSFVSCRCRLLAQTRLSIAGVSANHRATLGLPAAGALCVMLTDLAAARVALVAARSAAANDEIRRTQAWIDYIAANSKRGRLNAAAPSAAKPFAALCAGVAAAEVEQPAVHEEEVQHEEGSPLLFTQMHRHVLRFTPSPEHQQQGAQWGPEQDDHASCAPWLWHELAMSNAREKFVHPAATLAFDSAFDDSSFEHSAEAHHAVLAHHEHHSTAPTRQRPHDGDEYAHVEFPLVALGLGGSARSY